MIKRRKRGAAWVGIIILLIFVLALGLTLVTDSIATTVQSKRLAQIHIAQALGDAGIERAIWKLNENINYAGETGLILPTGEFDIEVMGAGGTLESRDILVTSYVPSKNDAKRIERKVRAKIIAEPRETSIAFNYAAQVGDLGLTIGNNARLHGSLYSSGNLNCGSNANITNDVFLSSAENGAATSVASCRIGGNVKAHTVTNSTISGWLRHVGLTTGTTAHGGRTQISKSAFDIEVPTQRLPISQLTIENWQSWASEGGVHAGNYTLRNNQMANLGPKIIEGNLTINNNSTLTLTGVVWVKGNIHINTNSRLRLDSSFGPNSSILLADNPNNRTGSGFIRIANNVTINGSDPVRHPQSHILILSTNTKESASDPAIVAENNSRGSIYYATSGRIVINNNAHLRAISGKGVTLSNNAEIRYDTGLASTNFSGGPGGSWRLKEWQVVY